jgi:hypothetical protein
MSDVKYLLFWGTGNRNQMRDRIRNYVRNMRLGMEVPIVKFEPVSTGPFYFGIAVNLDDPMQTEPNAKVTAMLKDLGITNNIVRNDHEKSSFFEGDKISNLVTDKFEYESFLKPIRFEKAEFDFDINDDDVFDENFVDNYVHTPEEQLMDHLLWWCTAKGEGSWGLFKDAAKLLGLTDTTKGGAWAVMRRFILLGDIEAVSVGRKFEWGATPTTLVKSSLAGAYISGKMTPVWRKKLTGFWLTSSNGGPKRVSVDPSVLIEGLPILIDPAGKLASVLPSYSEWMASLPVDPDIAVHRYSFKIYDGQGFVKENDTTMPPGLYEATRNEGQFTPKVVFFDGTRWLSGAFYDLRWLMIKSKGQKINAIINKANELFIPEMSRWPMIYERPLVLASGKLPRREKYGDMDVLIYESVGRELAQKLADKLGIDLQEG